MTQAIRRNIAEARLSPGVIALTGDACKRPFEDGSADLVVSRGSLPLWGDRPGAFRETHRALKKGGVAYAGSGCGTQCIRSRATNAFSESPTLKNSVEKSSYGMKRAKFAPGQIEAEVDQSSVEGSLEQELCGLWVRIVREGARPALSAQLHKAEGTAGDE